MDTTGNSSMNRDPFIAAANRRVLRRHGLSTAARFLRRISTRPMMREPSLLVRESAAEQLEERQSDWAYSRPIVVLDILWNLSFVAVAAGVLMLSVDEAPPLPLRVWIVGYAVQSIVHILCVVIEYRRRVRGGFAARFAGERQRRDGDNPSIVKHLESANTMFSFIWWIIGFYWVTSAGQELTHDSPQLYWLSIIFLAFDVFFMVFCVALACVIGIAVCCCLPCIIAILYTVADQYEGASSEEICQLPKYKFRRVGDLENFASEISGPCGGIMSECGSDSPIEHELSAVNAECCICICPYDDGEELRELPCSHHFHSDCIEKWLHINAICPLCKFNIIKSDNFGTEEV